MSMKKPQSLVSVTKVRLTVFYLETSAHGKKHIWPGKKCMWPARIIKHVKSK